MRFFFDRDVGTRLPLLLRSLKLPIEYHQELFDQSAQDDDWMPKVGRNNWVVFGKDTKHHVFENEIAAIKQHSIACFYLYGGNKPMWDILKSFAMAYDKIVSVIKTMPKPYIYRITETGKLIKIPIPE